MSNQISTNFANKYEGVFHPLVQQMTSKFRDKVMVKTVTDAENWYMDQIGAVTATEDNNQRSAITLSNTPHARRQITKRRFYWADTIEDSELTNLITDPSAAYTQNGLRALERSIDDIILTAAVGTAQTGKTGGTNVTFPTGNIVAAGGTGLSYAKMLATRKLLQNADVPYSTICMAIGPEQEEDLWGIPQFVERNYRGDAQPLGKKADGGLIDGYIGQFMDFEFYRTTRLSITTGTTRRCIAWVKEGVGLAIGLNPQVIVENRPDMVGSPKQIQVVMYLGASRLEEARVIAIDCVE